MPILLSIYANHAAELASWFANAVGQTLRTTEVTPKLYQNRLDLPGKIPTFTVNEISVEGYKTGANLRLVSSEAGRCRLYDYRTTAPKYFTIAWDDIN